jgi:DNA-binding NarL/FixJ family response regulator
VILDWQMPVMNGIEAARHIIRIAPATHIVMFTLHCDRYLVQQAQAAGIQHVISKSEGLPDLMASLRTLATA